MISIGVGRGGHVVIDHDGTVVAKSDSMTFKIVVKQGLETVAVIEGRHAIGKEHVSIKTLERILDAEQVLEFLTGFRFHIEEVK